MHKKRILIAEDDNFLAETIHSTLAEHTEVEVLAVHNGEEAIESIDAKQPDVLLLDLLMPKVDGFAVMKYVQQKGYNFPIVVLTNLSDEFNKDKCSELGCKDFFIKSDMDEDELWSIVEKYLL
jgi:CheY-like chemotaxis protein